MFSVGNPGSTMMTGRIRTGVELIAGMPPPAALACAQTDMASPAVLYSAELMGFLMIGGVTVRVMLTDC